ncbi:hypothetical protein [Vibrio fluvialis]|uniref:hypothetical protein n=1 Tax=Vibrio fluvialis TaxID=676 RepID=UPI00192A7783|nr:hypothetical protein [Vibrio fluvialis]MBL4262850.1 hypothetical protein [Vibrio fluvialis]
MLDGDKLVADLEAEIKANEAERDSAVENGWFEKAARLEILNEGLKRALRMINRGDYYLKTK